MRRPLFLIAGCIVFGTQLGFGNDTGSNKGATSGTKSQSSDPQQRFLVEAKVGYFFFTDSKMSKVYNNGGIDLQISGSYPIYNILHLYSSVEWLERSGHSLHDHQKTSIWEVPLSLGLQPVITIGDHWRWYFTLGPRYFFVHARNSSSYVSKSMNANDIGGFANTGFLYVFDNRFTLDLFGEYSYGRLSFHSNRRESFGQTVQVGGLTFGGGLGYSF